MLKKITYLWRNRNLEKISYVFSKGSFSYTSGNGCSIVNEVIRTISYFYKEKSCSTKNAKQAIFILLKVFVRKKKKKKFCCFLFAYFCFVGWFLLVLRFLCCRIFHKKIRSCPDKLIYCATDMYPSWPTYQEFICRHLFLFVIIWENLFFLWESFWIFSICKNLFFFMVICENLFFKVLMKISNSMNFII